MELMKALLGSRIVTEQTQVQPMKATVQKVFSKAVAFSRVPEMDEGFSFHVSRSMPTAPVWGATNPDAFITIQGAPPKTPVVGQVASIRGSNAPAGGVY